MGIRGILPFHCEHFDWAGYVYWVCEGESMMKAIVIGDYVVMWHTDVESQTVVVRSVRI